MGERRPGHEGPDGRTTPAADQPPDDVDASVDEAADSTTRRRLLAVSGGVLAVSALSIPAAAWHPNHYVIGAQTSHWAGEEPNAIAGEENPTLPMTVGEEYTVTWHNRDGNYHKLLIRNGDNEVLARSPGNNEEGGTESVTFVVTDEMDNYQCEPHFSMNGAIETQGASSSTPTEGSTSTDGSTSTRTEISRATRTETRTATGTSTTNEPASVTETTSDPSTDTATAGSTDTTTEADEPARADDGSPTETSAIVDDPDDQPVFGVGSLLAGLGGVGYLLRRRFRASDD